eukprot:GFUD01136878.1.p1 GENE.GFUD01136878.1~~GFUD01136878.1.p1  ORF type:complete len:120 (+),score=32.19 GFUD01136878.1:69-428(+)
MTLQKVSTIKSTMPSGGKGNSSANTRKRSGSLVTDRNGRIKRSRRDCSKNKTNSETKADVDGEKSKVKFEFACSKCEKGFDREDQLYSHEVSHVVQGDFRNCGNLKFPFENLKSVSLWK